MVGTGSELLSCNRTDELNSLRLLKAVRLPRLTSKYRAVWRKLRLRIEDLAWKMTAIMAGDDLRCGIQQIPSWKDSLK